MLERLSSEAFQGRAGAGLIEYRTVQLLDTERLADPILEHGSTNNVCEFRCEGRSYPLDYGALTGGRDSYIYPQHELVAAWAERLRADDGQLWFGMRVTGVEDDDQGATVSAVAEPAGERVHVRCRFVAGCDGARNTLLGALAGACVSELHHPFRWLALIADAAPSKPRTLYGLHRRGFAGQLRRGPHLTRYMLEIPGSDTIEDWPDDRIWTELQERLHAHGEPELAQGPLIEHDLLDLRVRVVTPMHHGRVYLAGDAAHLITPAGGKGMNLAIQDALELGCALRERYARPGDARRLNGYSATRLPATWRTQEFSNWMLALLHARTSLSHHDGQTDPGNEPNDFAYHLRRARLQELMYNPRLASWFAHAYAGADP